MTAPEDDDSEPRSTVSRREEFVDQTRREVVSAARDLFAEHGFERTTVERIARRARVSPATVYAQCGGKDGLLGSLIDMWTAGILVQTIIEDCAAVDSPRAKLQVLAEGYVEIYEEFGDIIRIVTRATSTSARADEFLQVANGRHLAALEEILESVRAAGDLVDGLSVADAARIVFFYFRYDQYTLAVDEFGWGVERATTWITGRVADSILR